MTWSTTTEKSLDTQGTTPLLPVNEDKLYLAVKKKKMQRVESGFCSPNKSTVTWWWLCWVYSARISAPDCYCSWFFSESLCSSHFSNREKKKTFHLKKWWKRVTWVNSWVQLLKEIPLNISGKKKTYILMSLWLCVVTKGVFIQCLKQNVSQHVQHL